MRIGNGQGMSIKHIGTSVLKFDLSNPQFTLSNLLYVPQITKNLVNVSKFAKDNHGFFEFPPEMCYIKS